MTVTHEAPPPTATTNPMPAGNGWRIRIDKNAHMPNATRITSAIMAPLIGIFTRIESSGERYSSTAAPYQLSSTVAWTKPKKRHLTNPTANNVAEIIQSISKTAKPIATTGNKFEARTAKRSIRLIPGGFANWDKEWLTVECRPVDLSRPDHQPPYA